MSRAYVVFLICLLVYCNIYLSNFSTNNFIQDAAPGDSGAPLYTLGDNSTSGEISDRYLLGIHSGGAGFAAILLQRGNVFFPSWWVKVSKIHL